MAKIKALLFDLDDTLLINDMEEFLPYYYAALLKRVAPLCSQGQFMEAMNRGVRAMWRNDGRNGTNAEVFYEVFYSRLPCSKDEMQLALEAFYAEDFNALSVHCSDDPMAYAVVREAKRQGLQVAIVTQPIFPKTAILMRMAWAGVGAHEFDYDFISCFEEMRSCKPHPTFFQAVVASLGREPEECLMIGDSPSADMAAGQLGMKTFWVDRGRRISLSPVECDAQGDLNDLIQLVRTGAINEL